MSDIDRLQQDLENYYNLIDQYLDMGWPRDRAEWVAKEEIWG